MDARPKNKTLIGLAELKVDKLDDIHRVLKNIDTRQRDDWQAHLRSKRRQVWIALTMALIAAASLYFEIVRPGDIDIFKHRISQKVQEYKVTEVDAVKPQTLIAQELQQ